MLSLVRTETVERIPKVRDKETVPDENFLPVKQDICGAMTNDRSKGVVTHSDVFSLYSRVGDKSGHVWEHVVRRSGISNKERGSWQVRSMFGSRVRVAEESENRFR